jgi:hypothetical protein
MAIANRQFIGQVVQLAGAASLAAAMVMSVHHVAIAVSLIGGAAAYLVGRKLRTV